MKHACLLLIVCACACLGEPSRALAEAGDCFRLENARIAVHLDKRSGGITAIENKLAGERYRVDDPGFKIQAGEDTQPGTLGSFGPRQCELKKAVVDLTQV